MTADYGMAPNREFFNKAMSRNYDSFRILPLARNDAPSDIRYDLDHIVETNNLDVEITHSTLQLHGSNNKTSRWAIFGLFGGGWFLEAIHISQQRAVTHARMHGPIEPSYWANGNPDVYPFIGIREVFKIAPFGSGIKGIYEVVYVTGNKVEDELVMVSIIETEEEAVTHATHAANQMECKIVPYRWQVPKDHPLLNGSKPFRVNLIITHDPAVGQFSVTMPDLPGCHSVGETLEKAILSSTEAAMGHIEETVKQFGGMDYAMAATSGLNLDSIEYENNPLVDKFQVGIYLKAETIEKINVIHPNDTHLSDARKYMAFGDYRNVSFADKSSESEKA